MNKRVYVSALFAWLTACAAAPSTAQEAIIERDVDLGTIVIIDASDPAYVQLDFQGNIHHSANVALLKKGTLGEISLFDFPKNTHVQVEHVIHDARMHHSDSSRSGIKIASLEMLPYVHIDQDGNGVLLYGATLQLDAHTAYADGTYYANMHFRFRY